MATSPSAARSALVLVTGAAVADLLDVAAAVAPEESVGAAVTALPLVVPAYYDAAGSLAVDWYEELREESAPSTRYTPAIQGAATTDWIEREVARYADSVGGITELTRAAILAELVALAEKEATRGFTTTVTGNTVRDPHALGWSRVASAGACRFCLMLAGKRTLYRSEQAARFGAHTNCHCAARPEFRGGKHGEEASVMQYRASARRASTPEKQAERNAKVREYLNTNYPDARG